MCSEYSLNDNMRWYQYWKCWGVFGWYFDSCESTSIEIKSVIHAHSSYCVCYYNKVSILIWACALNIVWMTICDDTNIENVVMSLVWCFDSYESTSIEIKSVNLKYIHHMLSFPSFGLLHHWKMKSSFCQVHEFSQNKGILKIPICNKMWTMKI